MIVPAPRRRPAAARVPGSGALMVCRTGPSCSAIRSSSSSRRYGVAVNPSHRRGGTRPRRLERRGRDVMALVDHNKAVASGQLRLGSSRRAKVCSVTTSTVPRSFRPQPPQSRVLRPQRRHLSLHEDARAPITARRAEPLDERHLVAILAPQRLQPRREDSRVTDLPQINQQIHRDVVTRRLRLRDPCRHPRPRPVSLGRERGQPLRRASSSRRALSAARAARRSRSACSRRSRCSAA